MLVRRLVFVYLSTFPLGECAFGDAAKDLGQIVSHGGDGGPRAAAEGMDFHSTNPTANGGMPTTSPKMPNLLAKARTQPADADKDIMSRWAQDPGFEMPRLAPPDEWRIKTWWIKHWTPIGRRLQTEGLRVLGWLALPFHLFTPLKQQVKPVSFSRLARKQTAAWEKPKPGIFSVFKEWLKNKMAIGSKKVTPVIPEKYHEELVEKLEGPVNKEDSGNPFEGLVEPRESKWRTPDYPPIFSKDPLVAESYNVGADINDLTKAGESPDSIKKTLITRLYDRNPAAAYSEADAKKLEQFVTSDEHLSILQRLYLRKNELLELHWKMQGVLNRVVSALGGEDETSETFRQIIQYHDKMIHGEESRIGDPEKKVDKKFFERVNPSPLMQELDPAAYQMHLSPLLYLEEVIKLLDHDAVVGLKDASGYIQNTPRLDVLKSAAEDVKKYASLSREVDILQKKVIQMGKYVPAFTKAHFKDQRTMKNIFKDLLSPDRVYPGIKGVKKASP
ncbi:hypothetical protein PGT21_009876 [Puccinia graminis f. sp. tritici]|uniref:Uncharacterized protein n=1 Tax=Puccinia graminis f. sp. tritici TaxID=56615 RepID=A0A5B0PKS4_PUCGR|nr:hypothetical protein PGT21_009768 [Puccinia graminis f. sp. tritici]KAA1101174.1 hypothetical protein PGT21_009876 [Puccinia graminis f. sp. tritici]